MLSPTLILWLTATWQLVLNQKGIMVERRATDRAGLYEVRVTGHANISPEMMAKTVWSHHEYIQFMPHLKSLKVLAETPNERLMYQQLKMPVVKDRDYTVRVRRSADPVTRVFESVFETANDAGPPEDASHVRVTKIKGSWTLSPDENGTGTDVVYQVYSDPGKELPLWIVNIAQNNAAPDVVRAMISRAERSAAKSAANP